MSISFWTNWARQGCLRRAEDWLARLRTLRAMALLVLARLLIATLPFGLWRKHLGGRPADPVPADLRQGRHLAAQVERAAWRLPIATKCLPRAMAVSWLLRSNRVGHELVFGVRPKQGRGGIGDLHAWIELNGMTIIGDLPGPWLVSLRLPSKGD